MFEQFYYYWLLWLFVIFVYFFIDKRKDRKQHLLMLLSLIVCSPYHLSLDTVVINIAAIAFYLFVLIIFIQKIQSYRSILLILIIGMLYLSLLLWEITMPIWFFVQKDVAIPVMMFLTLVLMESDRRHRYAIIITAIGIGSLVYYYLLWTYRLLAEINAMMAINHLLFACLYLLLHDGLYFAIKNVHNWRRI